MVLQTRRLWCADGQRCAGIGEFADRWGPVDACTAAMRCNSSNGVVGSRPTCSAASTAYHVHAAACALPLLWSACDVQADLISHQADESWCSQVLLRLSA